MTLDALMDTLDTTSVPIFLVCGVGAPMWQIVIVTNAHLVLVKTVVPLEGVRHFDFVRRFRLWLLLWLFLGTSCLL